MTDDIPERIYRSIPFKKCVVAGSFALYHYLKATGREPTWKPSDVDVVCKVESEGELSAISTEITTSVTDIKKYGPSNESIAFGVHTIHTSSKFDIDVVGIDTEYDIHYTHESTADPPTGVSFTVENGIKIFRASDRCLKYIHRVTTIPSNVRRPERNEKWRKRGWKVESKI